MAAAHIARTPVRIQLAAVAAALAAAGIAGAAHAQSYPPVDIRVVDRDTGQVLQAWRHDGKLYVAGRPGDRYSLRVTNHTDGRILVVMSVDGVNVLTGETAGYDQRGYIFSPHETYDVTGWRKSNTQVAAFTFATLSQSYAALTGRPGNVGVIGLAVFSERVDVPPPQPWTEGQEDERDDNRLSGGYDRPMPAPPPPSAAGAPSTMAPQARAAPSPSDQGRGYAGNDGIRRGESLGTGHGQREWSVINTVAFERATPYPIYVTQVSYDTYAHLVAYGVIPPPSSPPVRHTPQPFPGEPDGSDYVPDPPYRR